MKLELGDAWNVFHQREEQEIESPGGRYCGITMLMTQLFTCEHRLKDFYFKNSSHSFENDKGWC